MASFVSTMGQTQNLSDDEQKRVGRVVVRTKLGDDHAAFLTTLLSLIDSGKIDVRATRSLIKEDVYASMPAEWQAKVDRTLPNIADHLRQIIEYYRNPATPNDSVQLSSMIEYLWQMKQRIEEKYDVFIF